MAHRRRTKQTSILIDERDREALTDLCRATGVPRAEYLRLGLRIVLDAAQWAGIEVGARAPNVGDDAYYPGRSINLERALATVPRLPTVRSRGRRS